MTHSGHENPFSQPGSALAGALLAVAAIAAIAALSGCVSDNARSSRSGGTTVITLPNDNARIAEARDLALKAQAEDDTDAAIELYRQAVDAYPDLPAAWNNLGVLLLNEGRLMEASEAFASAAERSPNDPRPFFNLGLTWDRAGYLESALEHYAKSLRLDERYLPALRGAIKAETRLGESTPLLVERIRNALLIEQDPKWRDYLELQRSWAEAEVRSKAGLPAQTPSAGATR